MKEESGCVSRTCCGDRNLIILKATSFLSFAGFAIGPFLALRMKQLNVTEQEVAIINSFSPLLALFVRPLLTWVADMRKWHKQVFAVAISCGAISSVMVLFVPAAEGFQGLNVSWSVNSNGTELSNFSVVTTTGLPHEHQLFSNRGFRGSLTFWLVLMSRALSVALISPAWSICDATISNAVNPDKLSEFGKVRVFGSLGCLSLSTFYSLLTYFLEEAKVDYTYTFWIVCAIYFVVTVSSAIIFCFYKTSNLVVSASFTSALRVLSKDVRVALFVFSCFATGCIYGSWDIYCFWFLDDLGATSLCQSLMMTAIVVSEVAGMWMSTHLIKYLGPTHCIWITLASEMIHMGSYSLLQNAWYALAIEGFTQCITFGLFMPSSVVFVKECNIPGLEASLVGLSSAVTFSLGMSCGALVFGYIFSIFGARVAFLSSAMLALVILTIYVFADFATRKPRPGATVKPAFVKNVSDSATQKLNLTQHDDCAGADTSPVSISMKHFETAADSGAAKAAIQDTDIVFAGDDNAISRLRTPRLKNKQMCLINDTDSTA